MFSVLYSGSSIRGPEPWHWRWTAWKSMSIVNTKYKTSQVNRQCLSCKIIFKDNKGKGKYVFWQIECYFSIEFYLLSFVLDLVKIIIDEVCFGLEFQMKCIAILHRLLNIKCISSDFAINHHKKILQSYAFNSNSN